MEGGDPARGRREVLKPLVLLAVVAATLWLCVGTPEIETGDAAGVVMSLPEQVGAFRGEEVPMAEGERHLLPVGTQLARRRYGRGDGDWLLCTVVLSSADRRSIHKPEICLPGQGWATDSGRVIELRLADGAVLPAMCLDISRPLPGGAEGRMHGKFLYWFVGRDITTPHHWERIFRTAYDRIVRGVAHRWAYVSVMAVATQNLRPGGTDAEGAQRMIEEFLRDAAPQLLRTGSRRPSAGQ